MLRYAQEPFTSVDLTNSDARKIYVFQPIKNAYRRLDFA